MNKTKIDWAQYTWNPVTGCLHGCEYCYARGIAQRFGKKGDLTQYNVDNALVGLCVKDGDTIASKADGVFPFGFEPTFYPHRLDEPAKLTKPAHIFAVSMGDLFGEWVPEAWIDQVFKAMRAAPQHAYTVLTKNPRKAHKYLSGVEYHARSSKKFIGTSITGAFDKSEEERRLDLYGLYTIGCKTVLSLEPYLSKIDPGRLPRISWLIIGGLTGRKPFSPPLEWVEPLVEWAHANGIPVYCKHNCGHPGLPQEYPDGVPHDEVAR